MVLAATAALLVMAAARAAGVERPRLLALAGIAAVATGFTTHVFDAGHPANGLLPLLWIVAAVEARRGRALRAALVVGLSAGFETWGILGLAVLALAPSLRNRGAGRPCCRRVAALLYLPFVASGHFAMERYDWQIAPDSLLGHVFAPGTAFGWPLRLVQGAAVLVIGVMPRASDEGRCTRSGSFRCSSCSRDLRWTRKSTATTSTVSRRPRSSRSPSSLRAGDSLA